jgi:hypothetical protein
MLRVHRLKLGRNFSQCHDKPVVVTNRNEVPVEQPMNGCRQRNTVLNHVGSSVRNRPNVRRLRLHVASDVQYAQPRHSTPALVSFANQPPKTRIAYGPVRQYPFDAALAVLSGRCVQVGAGLRDYCEREV